MEKFGDKWMTPEKLYFIEKLCGRQQRRYGHATMSRNSKENEVCILDERLSQHSRVRYNNWPSQRRDV
ncbi:MAG: hypothetical protein U0894_19095 [Pirellulales bacterium]